MPILFAAEHTCILRSSAAGGLNIHLGDFRLAVAESICQHANSAFKSFQFEFMNEEDEEILKNNKQK